MTRPTARLAGHIALTAAIVFAPLAARAAEDTHAIEIAARAFGAFEVGSSETRFGNLVFLGGLELSSDDGEFGSLSGIDFEPGGRLDAITDRGYWISAVLDEEDGRPTGLSDARLGPLLDPAGNHPERKVKRDAEAIRIVGDHALVAFEQIHEIRSYPLPFAADTVPKKLDLPGFVRGLRANQGLEAVAVAPADAPQAGAIVAIAERSLDANGNHRGFILDGPLAGAFAITRTSDFDITDAAFLPDGDLVILERRFSYATGLAVRLRLLRGPQIRPGRIVDGTVLEEAGMGLQIDNLEGLALRTDAAGRVILTLVSDDNHSFLQRTLLLQFVLIPPESPLPRLRPTTPARPAQ